MVYAYTQDVPIDAATYERITDELGPEPIDGQLLHLCVQREDGSLYYIDVWESVEACAAAFDARIHPAVDRAFGGARPGTEPIVHGLQVIHATGAAVGAVTG